jgi:hypothetical protein
MVRENRGKRSACPCAHEEEQRPRCTRSLTDLDPRAHILTVHLARVFTATTTLTTPTGGDGVVRTRTT